MPPTNRDPFTDPKPGDVWRKNYIDYEVQDVYPPGESYNWPQGTVYLFGNGYRFGRHLDGGWQRWAKDAQVIHVS